MWPPVAALTAGAALAVGVDTPNQFEEVCSLTLTVRVVPPIIGGETMRGILFCIFMTLSIARESDCQRDRRAAPAQFPRQGP